MSDLPQEQPNDQPPAPRPLDVVVLAAGAGTRMRSKLPKMLHQVLGRPMVAWSVRAAQQLGARDIVVVTGHGAAQVEAALAPLGVRFARQEQQLGTGHAFLQAAHQLRGGADVLLLYGDSPMLPASTLRALLDAHRSGHNALTVLTSELPDATGYGRIIRAPSGEVLKIVEEKAATPQEKLVREFNSGVYVMNAAAPELAERIGNDNAAGEYYITDLLALYRQSGSRVAAFRIADPGEVMGANDRVQLAELENIMRARINEAHMRAGVTIQDPATTLIEDTVTIAPDSLLEPGVILRGETYIGEGVTVGAYSVLSDCVLEDGVTVKPHSVLEGSHVGRGSDVGPFARLRPGTRLGEGVHIGNFVETKNARLHGGVKAGHLAYLGDVEIGQETNIGAGTIVANFDGLNKHQSQIGAGVFIGSNSTLIAPRSIGDGAFVAGGSTLNKDVPEGAMAIARGQQRILEGWSRRYWQGMGEKVGQKLPWLAGWLAQQPDAER
ncbi:bifunctional UDP-N-acetylglucosamine diphosphorylase/glucosamine-1-phosphate N-acetyltransferase GlmU [Deinococcus sp. KNUC1210]|uniref:bifunctional UDP-N-acetylglucosamine diphosphorylase/glucosamine-1-phosphate N-acetyltransferase GlmU n=1 Tax=Deinococcus sp. KNUC1210 TaxID=2917691 RepID=UPI001EF0B3A4|nr:bifunctional UDP-N-acetylglucosamine diphosphorylase/glucosamine-1-phosphate N-acetyltransferase GlmU [Deinococcus sp. KNUC1210]ULH15600.1 bifunctional UDP-N-acetylglucosamine diphosphorylase/glucosamine-1-phosphate N-acetyltransferase GlmU [Deinococcus sp. KNUC1210]